MISSKFSGGIGESSAPPSDLAARGPGGMEPDPAFNERVDQLTELLLFVDTDIVPGGTARTRRKYSFEV